MKTTLDCIPCFVRQALDAARMASEDAAVQEQILRELLGWMATCDLRDPPPVMAQRMHRRLRELTGIDDPYAEAKARLDRVAIDLLPDLEGEIERAADPFEMAVRLAIAGNVIDLGARSEVTARDVRHALDHALTEPVRGPLEELRRAAARAETILYLADNAGEIVFDRLLVERLGPERVTVAVRGAPILNDATLEDARAVGITEIVEVIDNGSDAPGTILSDCSPAFRRRFIEADLVIAKGQGNYETLSDDPRGVFVLLKVKCPVIAEHVGQPVGTNVIFQSGSAA